MNVSTEDNFKHLDFVLSSDFVSSLQHWLICLTLTSLQLFWWDSWQNVLLESMPPLPVCKYSHLFIGFPSISVSNTLIALYKFKEFQQTSLSVCFIRVRNQTHAHFNNVNLKDDCYRITLHFWPKLIILFALLEHLCTTVIKIIFVP